MSTKKLFLFLTIFYYPLVTIGQADSTMNSSIGKPGLAFKMCPLSFVDPLNPSYQFAIEYKVKKNLNLQHELGYITRYASPFFQSIGDISGIRFRSELRHYFRQTKFNDFYYWCPEILVKVFSQDLTREYSRYDGAYFEVLTTQQNITAIAFHLKFGSQLRLFKGTKTIIDVYGGLGLRYIKRRVNDLPEDANIVDFMWGGGVKNGEYFYPSATLGLKLGYQFK